MQKPHTDAALGLGTTDSGKLPGKRATRIRALGLTGPTSLFEYFFFFKAKQRWVCHKKYARSAEVSSFKGRTISPSWLKRKWCFVFTTEWNAASVSPEFLCSEDLSFQPGHWVEALGPACPEPRGPSTVCGQFHKQHNSLQSCRWMTSPGDRGGGGRGCKPAALRRMTSPAERQLEDGTEAESQRPSLRIYFTGRINAGIKRACSPARMRSPSFLILGYASTSLIREWQPLGMLRAEQITSGLWIILCHYSVRHLVQCHLGFKTLKKILITQWIWIRQYLLVGKDSDERWAHKVGLRSVPSRPRFPSLGRKPHFGVSLPVQFLWTSQRLIIHTHTHIHSNRLHIHMDRHIRVLKFFLE